jgi:hypothetical protein
MRNRRLVATLTLVALVCLAGTVARARSQSVDITGKWKASFETQIGTQSYTYDFVVKDGKLTGKAASTNGESELKNGTVEADKVSFVENLKFMDMEIAITYTGKVVSADEIKFTRQVGEFATEELVAKRVK